MQVAELRPSLWLVARERERWGSKDLRQFFPVPRERHDSPRFGGVYRTADGQETICFESGGGLTWDGEAGDWRMHGAVLHVAAGERAGEGAIDANAIYLLSASGRARSARRQSVFEFNAEE